MRVVVHLATSNPDILAEIGKSLQIAQPGGEAQPHDDGLGLDWSVEVPLVDQSFELQANRLVLELGESLRHAAAAGAVVQIEIAIVPADRKHMSSHVGLSFQPAMLAKLGAWGIALSVSSDAA